MQPNRTLGNFDMALSLSSSKINHQFKIMSRKGVINDKWAFLTDSMGRGLENLSGDEVEKFLDNSAQLKAEIASKSGQLEEIDGQLENALENDDSELAKELFENKKVLKAELKKLKEQSAAGESYDLGMIATIKPPEIEILKQNTTELLFRISLDEGSYLFFSREGRKVRYDLGNENIVYAFRVKIGKVHITSAQKIITIDESGKVGSATLADQGISDTDFTIESLFMDFENSNVADYDRSNSQLTKDAEANSLLQAALGNYFNSLKGTNNPYILGYGIQKKVIQPSERAMFFPTGVRYSTSFSTQNRASSFNFMMLTNNHAFPTTADAGIMPVALLEFATDKTATVNAMFAINQQEFVEIFIPELTKELAGRISIGGTRSQQMNDFGFRTELRGHSIKQGTLEGRFAGINQGSNGIEISYTLTAKALVHQEIEEMIGTVGVDWRCSTSGRENGSNGHSGTLKIILQAGASGRLQLTPSYRDHLAMGFDTRKPEYKHGLDELWDSINKVIGEVVKILTTLQLDIGKGLDNLTNIDNLANSIRVDKLEKLNNRVILPVSTVYMFKNVQLLRKDQPSDCVILFDATYGVQS